MEQENETQAKKVLNINVGILGHVDSGKTTLVKALSTSLSTAALDKNPQSQARGITLDLGFSAFTLPIPEHLVSLGYDLLQFTLVDCPGHASLIRTIIGGAQIIDMILLVIDANKGIQTQTAECIVIGEITTDNMIVVLNKVDMIPENEREQKLDKVTKRIRKVFSATKFANVPIVAAAAAIGGEKIASISALSTPKTTALNSATTATTTASTATGTKDKIYSPAGTFANTASYGVDKLIDMIHHSIVSPIRHYDHPFYYAIDHCFAIRGHGTVVTGTVLSGTVKVNQIIELPELQKQKKIKSMQMFHKKVNIAYQGDRVGICFADLDPKSIERGIAAAPGSVPLLHSVICLVKKVRFFKFSCRSEAKFHITVGHTTVLATVAFFGAAELAEANQKAHSSATVAESNSDINVSSSSNSTSQDVYASLSDEVKANQESDTVTDTDITATNSINRASTTSTAAASMTTNNNTTPPLLPPLFLPLFPLYPFPGIKILFNNPNY